MEPKFSLKDVDNLIDTFVNLIEKGVKNIGAKDLTPLLQYPDTVVNEFINTIEAIPNNPNYIREHYDAIRVYIGIRLNLV